MENAAVKDWYDPEGDFLEVTFQTKAGYFRETDNDQVMEKVDSEGNALRYSIMKVSHLKNHPLQVALN